MTARENLNPDYGRLTGFLRGISLRIQLLATLEFLFLLPSGFILVLLGSFFVFELKGTFPYLPFLYAIASVVFLLFLLILAVWRVASRPSLKRVARVVEEAFPRLRDDVTNSLLLFDQIGGNSDSSRISEKLIFAQIRKTAGEIASLHPRQIVTFKKALWSLRLFLPLLISFSMSLALDPHFLSRSLAMILHPFSTLPMRETFLSLDPKGGIVLRGTPILIQARATGYLPDQLALMIWSEGNEPKRVLMEAEGEGRFRYRIALAQDSFSYQAVSGNTLSSSYTLQVVDPPEIKRIRLTLNPPDYSGLPVEVREEGGFEALQGTAVTVEAWTTRKVVEGRLIFEQENQLVLNVQEDRLTGGLLALSPGTYTIKIRDSFGFENPNPAQYPIRIKPDRYPEAEVLSPAQDLDISGNETLPIVYTGEDDFGITGVRLYYQIGGRDGSIQLKNAENGRRLGPETFKWDLGSLGLAPGDRVTYRVEIWDNDTISGPKKGTSQTHLFSVRDDRAQLAREGEEAQQIADALLDLLADQLEELKDGERLAYEMENVLKQVDQSLGRMKDRLDRFDLEALRRNLLSLKNRVSTEPRESVTQELERLALVAEDIAKRSKMNEVEALAKELRNRQRRLLDSIKDLKDPLKREDLEAVMEELKKLEALLHSLMETLSKMAPSLPEEFINSPELSGLEFQDFFKDLRDIQNQLMAGDLEGALEAAQRLLQALSEMVANLARAGSQAGRASSDRLQGEMSRQAGELEKIINEQKEILRETERIDREIKRRGEEETETRFSQSLRELEQLLEELVRTLPPDAKEGIDELKALLKRSRVEPFSQMIEKMERDLAEGSGGKDFIRRLRELVGRLIPDPKEVADPEDRRRFPDLARREEDLRERTRRLNERLEMLAQLFPGMDTEILKGLKEATGSMGKASGKLRTEDAPGAVPPEQEAIQILSRSQQAMQQMAQQMAMQMQAARWGYPYGYDPRPGWYYGPWIPMPTLPQPELRRPIERGYTGIDREEFEPPSKDAYRVPKIFREKVIESLKEEVPPRYKRDVENYFRGLTR